MNAALRVFRYLQGERPGMSAGGGKLSHTQFHYPIHVQTIVRIADVSFWQGEINFAVMRAVGIAGAIIRAGQRYWEDICFRENWRKAKEAGVPRGSYWFYDSREDPKKQAALWWSLLQSDGGELVHVADFEESYGGPYGLPSHFRTFLQEFQRLSGLPTDRIVIYTGFYYWSSRVGNDAYFRQFALWIAWYSTMEVVRVPAPWIESDLFAWQYTSSGDGSLYGVSSLEIDLSWYCCDMRTYSLRFNLGASSPGGGTMQVIRGTVKGNLVRRDAPSGNQFSPPRYLYTGDTIEADRNQYQWLHLTKINGAAVTGDEWASAGATQQYIEWAWVTVEEPPPPDPEPVKTPFTLVVDGYKPFSGELEAA